MEQDNDERHIELISEPVVQRQSRRYSVAYPQTRQIIMSTYPNRDFSANRRASTGELDLENNFDASLEENRFMWRENDRNRIMSMDASSSMLPIPGVIAENTLEDAPGFLIDRYITGNNRSRLRDPVLIEMARYREIGELRSQEPTHVSAIEHPVLFVSNGNDHSEVDWNALDEVWMPKLPRLHSGKTRYCVVCHAPLQYSTMQSWDEYLESEEYVNNLQNCLLQDCFITNLICCPETSHTQEGPHGLGENPVTGMGDLPIEHRMHKNRKLKCRQSVLDYQKMTSAGIIDPSSSVRLLEEMLSESLPTPLFTYILERRFAVVYHSTSILSKLLKRSRIPKLAREYADTPSDTPNVGLHHVAIRTLSVLLGSFNYSSGNAMMPLQQLSSMLEYCPALSLFSFWSPPSKQLEADLEPLISKVFVAGGEIHVDCTPTSISMKGNPIEAIFDDKKDTYWQTHEKPGKVVLAIKCVSMNALPAVSSVHIVWHDSCVPKSLQVQSRALGKEQYDTIADIQPSLITCAAGPPSSEDHIDTDFPSGCAEIRFILDGMSESNTCSRYGIKSMTLYAQGGNTATCDVKRTITDISVWISGAFHAPEKQDDPIKVEAITSSRSWALTTGSLSATLHFVKLLLSLTKPDSVDQSAGIDAVAYTQGNLFLRDLKRIHTDRNKCLIDQASRQTGSARCSKLAAVFEASVCSAGVVVEEGGLSVRTRETSYQYAAVNVGVSSGKASWKFRLDNDALDDEMTCFGAAILPVNVCGYDSSPSLWMLRGYNGNLYARGQKLSRSLCKIHPGDIVQIDVDMKEGTLSYKVNEADYGVVFTDLLGHEVYPAVSFYGSNKVISLVSMHKWAEARINSTGDTKDELETVYLSALNAYHFSAGYDAQGDNESSKDVRIQGETMKKSISFHPTSVEDAYVIYDIQNVYTRIMGHVALPDGGHSETLEQKGAYVTFSLLCDGKLAWQSDQIRKVAQINSFDIDVKGIRMLELRVICSGPCESFQAVWVEPRMLACPIWNCERCHYKNRGVDTLCFICRDHQDSVSVTSTTTPDSANPIDTFNVSSTTSAGEHPKSFYKLVCAILSHLRDLARISSSTILTSEDGCLAQMNEYRTASFEEPFCRTPDQATLTLLLDLLQQFHQDTGSAQVRPVATKCCLCVLELMRYNLCGIRDYVVTVSMLRVSMATVQRVRKTLEGLVFTNDPKTYHEETSVLAAKTIVSALSILYPPPSKLIALLSFLLESNRFSELPASSILLSSIMELLSQPGEAGILNLISFARPQNISSHKMAEYRDESKEVGNVLKALIRFVAQQVSKSNDAAACTLARHAVKVLRSYQLLLLSETVQITMEDTPAKDGSQNKDYEEIPHDQSSDCILLPRAMNCKKGLLQESTIQYGMLLLQACREFVEDRFSRTTSQDSGLICEMPLLSSLLPWFIGCMCLLRRQTWLARPMLPPVVRFIDVLNRFCVNIPAVTQNETHLRQLESYVKARQLEARYTKSSHVSRNSVAANKAPSSSVSILLSATNHLYYNVFKQLYTGEKDHFEGQIGFQFEATSTFCIVALGRSVNSSRNGGRLLRVHPIRLWEESSQLLIAQTSISATSRKDGLGYAFEPLLTPVKLTQGKLYRLTTEEYANSGDPWYKKENSPDEEYDTSYIRIICDCYASSSCGFPNSQNLAGAAYGVPTFLVKSEAPFNKIQHFLTPSSSFTVRFSKARKASSIAVSHSGMMANALSEDRNTWRSVIVQPSVFRGIHSMDFIIKSSRKGGIISGHIVIGVDWRQYEGPNGIIDPHWTSYDTFLGNTSSSVGWMPSLGALWVNKKRFAYGESLSLNAGDILTLRIDYEQHVISFLYNGRHMGNAYGSSCAMDVHVPACEFPNAINAGVSICSMHDLVELRPSGICGSTLQIHWLMDMLLSLSSTGAQITGTLISGAPTDLIEEELMPWLQSPLLSGGISDKVLLANSIADDWKSVVSQDMLDRPSNNANACSATFIISPTCNLAILDESSLFASASGDTPKFIEKDYTIKTILCWLEQSSPDTSILSRFGRFPDCERLTCSALIKHAPIHVLHEVDAICTSYRAAQNGFEQVDAENIQLVPSEDMLLIWKKVLSLRHWLIRMRQEYRSRDANGSDVTEKPTLPSANSHESSRSVSAAMKMEKVLSPPSSFDELTGQICQRASFLCHLDPPSDDKERLSIDSQLALGKLAEKWSAEKTPPSLEPMLERWRTLTESDKSKWSGMVSILRAQHRWRVRRAHTNSIDSLNLRDEAEESLVDEEDDEEAKCEYKSFFAAMLKACDLYIRNGIGAPPQILRALLERRQKRLVSRTFGFDAFHSLLKVLSFDSARLQAVIFLRPALRGFVDGEKENQDKASSQKLIGESSADAHRRDSLAPTETVFRATVQHHYTKGLEGCHRSDMIRVQKAFYSLYLFLAQLLHPVHGSGKYFDPQLKQAVLSSWCLDFEARDHSFLLKSGILEVLHDMYSVQAIANEDLHHIKPSALTGLDTICEKAGLQTIVDSQRSLLWLPLSEDFVQKSILHTGLINKRDVIRLLLHCPGYECIRERSGEDKIPDSGDSELETIRYRSASSMALVYAEHLRRLIRHLSSRFDGKNASKLLHFGRQTSKAPASSCVLLPCLGRSIDFTLEMWIYPEELKGTRTLLSADAFASGCIFLELVGSYVQLSINGNAPREQLIQEKAIPSHEWTHISVVYRSKDIMREPNASMQLFVNGKLATLNKKNYTVAVEQIDLRSSFVGRWLTQETSAKSGLGDRRFRGFITEVRIWKLARSQLEIESSFECSEPFINSNTVPKVLESDAGVMSNAFLCLWHLNEGEGLSSNAHILTTSTPWCFESVQTQSSCAAIGNCQWTSMSSPVLIKNHHNLTLSQWKLLRKTICKVQRIVRQSFKHKRVVQINAAQALCTHQEKSNDINCRGYGQDPKSSGIRKAKTDKPRPRKPRNRASSLIESCDMESSASPMHPIQTPKSDTSSSETLSTDDIILHRKQIRHCAWVVFRFLVSVAIHGFHERREAEATAVAAIAKSKRKEKVRNSIAAESQRGIDSNEKSTAPDVSYGEEERSRTAEAASDAAKIAAANRDLKEPELQILWFSIEFHRKAFEMIETELSMLTSLTIDAEHEGRLLKAQRMTRSRSTPIGLWVPPAVSEATNSIRSKRNVSRSAMQLSLEPLEIEHLLFRLLSFVLSQTSTMVTLSYISKPRMLKELFRLLQIASPRCQRLIKYLLRAVCRNGFVKPAHVRDLLGSEAALIEVLLDQVAEAFCTSASPLQTHAVRIPNANTSADPDNEILMFESLSSPVGFRAGQIYLAQASESIALLRLLLWETGWKSKVISILGNVIRSLSLLLSEPDQDAKSLEEPKGSMTADIRLRTAVVRSVGALCVLGSQADCIRVGGKVNIKCRADAHASNVSQPRDDGRNFGNNGAGLCTSEAAAKVIELYPQLLSARVVLETQSDESGPNHNVQDVSLTSITPIEEVQLPSQNTITSLVQAHPKILSLIAELALGKFEAADDYNELWPVQIQSRALLALETIIRSHGIAALNMQQDFVGLDRFKTLLSTALSPSGLDAFLSLSFLQERGRMILCRLIEASSPLGKDMFYGLDEPKCDTALEDSCTKRSQSKDAGSIEEVEESEEYRLRRGFAATLAAMGFELDLCMTALERSRDDPHMAVEWLMSEEATAYQERQQIRRLAAASLESKHGNLGLDANGDGSESSHSVRAEELSSVSDTPSHLAYSALEICNWETSRALEWLLEHGKKYADDETSMQLLSDTFQTTCAATEHDSAALEDSDQPDPLIHDSSSRNRSEFCITDPQSEYRNVQSPNTDPDTVAITLAPILARSVSGALSEREHVGFAPLDPSYLRPYMLLAANEYDGSIQQVSTNGRIGIFRRISEDHSAVLVTFLNTETGAFEDEWYPPEVLRRITKVYDEPIHHVESIHRVALRTEKALTVHYARRVIVALMAIQEMSMANPNTKEFSTYALDAIGGPMEYLRFLKLVAAPDLTNFQEEDKEPHPSFIKHPLEAALPEAPSPVKKDNTIASLLPALQRMTLKVLQEESIAKKTTARRVSISDTLLSNVMVADCVNHFVASTRVASESLLQSDANILAEPFEFQSLHPYFGLCDYLRAVSIDEDCRSVRIVFDQRTKLGPTAKLSIFSDSSCETKLAYLDASCVLEKIPDLVIHSNKFWFRFVSTEQNTSNYYGYRFRVKRIPKILWINEKDVFACPSLEWACWLLEFLLHDATCLVKCGAVHNREIFESLVRYLRSPGAPFKNRIVRLLIHLLSTASLFHFSQMPSLEPLKCIGKLAMDRAKTLLGQDNSRHEIRFVSAHLLQMVELGLISEMAAKQFEKAVRADSLNETKAKQSESALSVSHPQNRDTFECLYDTACLLRFLLGKDTELPQRVLTSIWHDTFGKTKVIESSHPYSNASKINTSIHFSTAQSILIHFDPRCATADDVHLELESVALVPISHIDESAQESDEGQIYQEFRTCRRFSGSDVKSWPTTPIELAGDTLNISLKGDANPHGHYGVSFTIMAVGVTVDKQMQRPDHATIKALQERLVVQQKSWTMSDAQNPTPSILADAQLVDWVNVHVENLTTSSTPESIVSTHLCPYQIRLDPQLDVLRCSFLFEKSLEDVHLRFALIKHFNECLQVALPFLDLRNTRSPWTVAHQIRQTSHCIFFDIKNPIVEAAIDATEYTGDSNSARITLDRLQAVESRDDREVEPSISECFFAQAFRQLHDLSPEVFRRKIDNKGRLFNVKFRGEEGVDWGGVYREGANSIVDDLFSAHFNLFILCPNGQHDTGINRSMYLPNPKCNSPIAMQMYELVGKLLGISLRTHGDFPFAFPSLIWKQILGQQLDRSDLEGTDAMLLQMLDGIRACENDGIATEAEFNAAFEGQGLDLRFTTFDCNGKEVELIENGKDIPVTFQNRHQYCTLVEHCRLNEGSMQIAAMTRGFATIFPLRVLTLLTWQEMELLTCGSPKIDINVWKQHTRYDGYDESDDTVALFWNALESFTDEQRSDFVRFAWGRSRLPRGKWPQPFKLTKKGGRDATLSLPVAHTCFFSVELPPYTCMEKMRNMLLATITFGLGGILMA